MRLVKMQDFTSVNSFQDLRVTLMRTAFCHQVKLHSTLISLTQSLIHTCVLRLAFNLMAMSTLTTTMAFAQGYSGNTPLPHPYPNGNVHRLIPGDAPPGMIGGARLQRWGAVGGHFQGVAFRGPGTTQFSLSIDGVFQPPSKKSLCAGLLIGSVYRFKITSIPGYEGEELFPTVEIIDRTYPPESLAARFPIPINLEMDDLEDALQGRLVTRVIYLEDPGNAVPLAETSDSSRALDVPGYQDPLAVADELGKPVAIVRLGSLAPPTYEALLPQFFMGYPPWVHATMDAATGDTAPLDSTPMNGTPMNTATKDAGPVEASFSDQAGQ